MTMKKVAKPTNLIKYNVFKNSNMECERMVE